MNIRNAVDEDYYKVIAVIDEWWGGRQMADMLPHLFFKHFSDTSYIIEDDEKMIGFLVAFISQTHPNESYIHFFGVDPAHRKKGVGKKTYAYFNDQIKSKGCNTVCLVTSVVNKTSIAYHTAIGFEIVKGEKEIDGISVHPGYDGIGSNMVLFRKELT